ncbi:hypothetical protein LJR153_006980 [Paenibacillus sp. LjRoot153]|uniref:hypothetical protein n=1 Tax=Paenibacillus sp. LjRoot153 TaxID=3342270 RepID=UPI003ECF80D6
MSRLNKAILSRPVITFKNLELTGDSKIGVDDIAIIASSAESDVDMNQDGIFDREDVSRLLSQISRVVE